jgi:hypothetical protein
MTLLVDPDPAPPPGPGWVYLAGVASPASGHHSHSLAGDALSADAHEFHPFTFRAQLKLSQQ